MRTVLAGSIAVLVLAGGATAAPEPVASPRAAAEPTAELLAISGDPCCGRVVARLDPISLRRTGPRATLGEYHDNYSFSPDGSQVAFGISAPSETGDGRVGIRVVDTLGLTFTRDVPTGVFAKALAWVEPRRLVAVLGHATRFICPEASCTTPPPPQPEPDQTAVVTVDPTTGEVLQQSRVPRPCDTAEVRTRALVSLAGAGLSVVGADGAVETVSLPDRFDWCGQIATGSSDGTVFAISKGDDAIAKVGLAGSKVTLYEIPGGATVGGEAFNLDGRRLVLPVRDRSGRSAGVQILDTETNRLEPIDREAWRVRVAGRTLLAIGARPSQEAPAVGIRGYDLDGRRLFWVLRRARVAGVEVGGRFAYAFTDRGFAIIDVRSGRVVERSSAGRRGLDLLTTPTAP